MLSCTSMLAGRYRLQARIAAGGFGEVWRGTDVVLSRTVAIKLLQAGYAQHPEALDRFRAEARHAGALSHENVAHVYDYGEPDPPQPPFLVMELVDGPSLAQVLRAGTLSPPRVMDIVAQVAAGLHAAHQGGFVHRDIKPANLLLSRDGPVKVTDFGISHAAGAIPLTFTGVLVGTPAYLAPERVGGSRATPASDLYSLGIVAYECLAGVPPFLGLPLVVAQAHRDRPVPPLPQSVPAGVASLILELTAKDPGARPQDAAEVCRRASLLREQIGAAASPRPPGRRAVRPATGRALPHPDRPAGRAPQQGRRAVSRQFGLSAAMSAAAVVAGLIGLVLTGVIGPAAASRPDAAPSSTSFPTAPAALMVEVNGGVLRGEPVRPVVRRLHRLGFAVRVLWRPDGGQPAGTVVSVRPGGAVAPGSVVVVVGALAPRGSSSGMPRIRREPDGSRRGQGRHRSQRNGQGNHGKVDGGGYGHGGDGSGQGDGGNGGGQGQDNGGGGQQAAAF